MKILATAMVTLGLLVSGLTLASPAATAAAPYPHTVPTVCKVKPRPAKMRQHQRVGARVRIAAGGAHPKPLLRFKAIRKRGHQVQWISTRRYHGHPEVFLTKRLHRPGMYRIQVRALMGPTSVFKNCRTSFVVRVIPRR